MSYEGYTEQLCANGHYSAQDCYAEDPKACPDCGAAFAFSHGVDQTNGYDKRDPHTFSAKKVEIGFSDVWRADHHGNRYATKLIAWAPAPRSAWRKLAASVDERAERHDPEEGRGPKDASAVGSEADETP